MAEMMTSPLTAALDKPKPDNLAARPILATKLYAPPPRPNLVGRRRLIHRLEQGLQLGCKLTLISASAGFGKTTLISEWLQLQTTETDAPHTPAQIVWLSLDADDNDPARFLTYLVAACQKLEPSIGQTLLQLSQLPPADTLVTLLVNDLVTIPHTFALVLDDYHVIHTPLLHEIVELLLKRQPPQMHLIIITREDPPLPLPRLRVRGQVIELRQQDLRFTAAESATFLNQTMGLNLTPKAIQALEDRTEGWIAGLQLAALSLQGRTVERVDDFINAFSGSHRYVIDYLVEEVIQQQPHNLRQFLIQTSALDRFCPSLCDAITGRKDSRAIFAKLEHDNLFLIPLDDRREWYRYHHLFSEFLRTEMKSEQQLDIYLKAAYWFESNGFLAEAIKYALAAANFDEAGRLINRAADGALYNGELVTLTGWLNALPDEFIRSNGELSIYKGWASWIVGDAELSTSYMEAAEAALKADAAPEKRGKLVSLQACLALTRKSTGLQLAKEALELLGDKESFFRDLTLLLLAESQNLLGDTEGAVQTFSQALRIGQQNNDHFLIIGAAANLAQQFNWQGKRQQAVALCQQTIDQCVDARGQPLPFAGLAYITLAEMIYWANHLSQAKTYIEKGTSLHKQQGLLGSVISINLVLAPLQAAMGDVHQALETIQKIYRLTAAGHFESYYGIMAALEADFQLKIGNITAVKQWAEAFEVLNCNTLTPFEEFEHIIYVRFLLTTNRPQEALDLLSQVEHSTQKAGRNFIYLLATVLRVLAETALNHEKSGLATLEKALKLAEPETYRRPFLDANPRLMTLLPQVHHVAPKFVDSLLEAFAKQSSSLAAPQPEKSRPINPAESLVSFPSSKTQPLLEPLSERELEILQLVAYGQSNRTIAKNIFVTVGTVKKHLSNIFGKLGVKSRTQAVARARDLGLF